MTATKEKTVKETSRNSVENKESTKMSAPSKKIKETVDEFKLEVQGKADHIYNVKVEGERINVTTGEIIIVKTQEEADRLSKVDDLSGKLLFNILGGNE